MLVQKHMASKRIYHIECIAHNYLNENKKVYARAWEKVRVNLFADKHRKEVFLIKDCEKWNSKKKKWQ